MPTFDRHTHALLAGIAIDLTGCPTTRPTHVSHPAIDYVCETMHAADRGDLVHYAGACYRDEVAWQMVRVWLAGLWDAPESELKSKALKLAGW